MPKRPSRFGGESRAGSSTGSYSGEIDLREEFDILVYGDANNIPHGFPLIIRNLRRDSAGKRIECTCLRPLTLEADPYCSYCDGEGYLWDEQWAISYRYNIGSDGGLSNRGRWIPSGMLRVDDLVFFLRYDTQIRYGDKIIEVELDTEGSPVVPYVRKAIYKPSTIDQLRSDYGRIEYIAAYCREEDIRRADQ